MNFKPNEQSVQLFTKHCENCPKLTNCIDAFHLNQTLYCDNWNIFIQFMIPAEEYIKECIYNEFIKIQEDQRRRQNDCAIWNS